MIWLSIVPMPYRLAILAVAFFVVGGLGYIKGIEHEEARYQKFVAQTEVEGRAAQKAAADRIASDKLNKERSDHENELSLSTLRADNDRLRKSRSSSGYLPASTPSAKDPDRACFKRADLERAIQRLDGRVSGIVEAGDVARVNLDTAKKWAVPSK